MLVSDVGDLSDLVGRRVRTLMDFSGVVRNTEGVIVSVYGTRRKGIMVEWDRCPGCRGPAAIKDGMRIHMFAEDAAKCGHVKILEAPRYGYKPLQDGFGRDERFDETSWLELVD